MHGPNLQRKSLQHSPMSLIQLAYSNENTLRNREMIQLCAQSSTKEGGLLAPHS